MIDLSEAEAKRKYNCFKISTNLISPGRKVGQERNTHAPASEFNKESNACPSTLLWKVKV